MQATIRNALKKDVSAIVALLAHDKLGQLRENLQVPLSKKYYKAFEKIEEDPNQHIFVMENEDGKVIGTLQISFIQYLTYQGGIRSQIEAVRIHPDYREGPGQKLFDRAIDFAKSKGAHLVQLTTDKKRPEAIEFYKRLGFMASHEGMKLHF